MPGFLNEVLIRGIAREQVPPMFELAEHDKHMAVLNQGLDWVDFFVRRNSYPSGTKVAPTITQNIITMGFPPDYRA